jgi:peptidoglycan/xylan/chitin deacetylase (PgdA/CDA1 family)
MKKNIFVGIMLFVSATTFGQSLDLRNELASQGYIRARAEVVSKFKNIKAGKFGETVPGMLTHINTGEKIAALTFDACGGPTGSAYDSALIEYLRREKISATLFVSGAWIERNDSLFRLLCKEPLFEIENHGLGHCPCSVVGKSRYKIAGTENAGEVFDEIELNARQIEFYTKSRPRYYRPAAAAADEGCVAIAKGLREKVVSFEVLSGDAVEGTKAEVITQNIVNNTRPGSIIIMHMNHPERNGFEALIQAVPELRKRGYSFVKLEGQTLSGKK